MSNLSSRNTKSFFQLLKETNIFWSLSGASILLLEKSYTDHNKYKNLGAAVLLTGIFAAISASMALSYMTENWLIITLISLLWGVTIINLDMLIVGTMIKYSKWSWRSFGGFLSRLTLTAIIAISISVPFEMTLLNDEIRDEIDAYDRKTLNAETEKIKDEFKELETLKKRKEELQARFIDEMQGKDGSSGKVGYRDIAKKIEKEKEIVENRIQFLENQKDSSLQKTTTTIIGEQQRNNKYGFLASFRALHRLEFGSEDKSVFTISIGIKILLLFIELMPIISKSIIRRGVYDAQYELEEKRQMLSLDKERVELEQ